MMSMLGRTAETEDHKDERIKNYQEIQWRIKAIERDLLEDAPTEAYWSYTGLVSDLRLAIGEIERLRVGVRKALDSGNSALFLKEDLAELLQD